VKKKVCHKCLKICGESERQTQRVGVCDVCEKVGHVAFIPEKQYEELLAKTPLLKKGSKDANS
jgi:hypothetical protein